MIDRLIFRVDGIVQAILRNCLFSICLAILSIGIALSISNAIVCVWNGEGVGSALFWLALFSVCFILKAVVEAIGERFSRKYSQRQIQGLSLRYMQSIYSLGSVNCAVHSSTSAIESVQGMDNISNYLRTVLPRITDMIVIPLCVAVAILTQDVISAVIVCVCFPFIIVFMVLIGHNASDDASKRHDGFKRMSGHFADSIRGIFTLKAFGAAKGYAKKVHAASERYRKMTMKTLRVATLSSSILDIFSTCALAAVAIMLGFRLVDEQIGFLPALIVLVLVPEFFKPIKSFASNYHATLSGNASLRSVFQTIDKSQVETSKRFERESFENAAMVDEMVLKWGKTSSFKSQSLDGLASAVKGKKRISALHDVSVNSGLSTMTFRGVDCEHKGSADALRGIDFKIAYGDVSVIIGPTGSGKSTLADIIAGFSSPTNGKIFLNDCELLSLARTDWRQRVAYIPQSPHIFNATLRENLAFYRPDASDDEICSVISRLGLSEMISSFDAGLDTLLGDGARQVSGGQAQRIALARVLLDPRRDIWVLDEISSHLDIETELELKDVLIKEMRDKTVFIVTHRAHWLCEADNIINLDRGRLVEFEARERVSCVEPDADLSMSLPANPIANPTAKISEDQVVGSSIKPVGVIKVPCAKQGSLAGLAGGDIACIEAASVQKHRDAAFDDVSAEKRGKATEWLKTFLTKNTKLLVVSILLALVVNVFASALMFTSGYMISLAASIPLTVLALHIPSIFVRIFGIGKPCIAYVERLISHDWILRLTSMIRERLFRYADMTAGKLHDGRIAVGRALGLLTQNIEHAQDALIRGLLPLIVSLMTFVLMCILACVFSPQLALALFIVLGIVVVLFPIFACRQNRANFDELNHLTSALLSDSQDAIFGLRDWVLSGREADFLHKMRLGRQEVDSIEDDMAFSSNMRRIAFDVFFSAAVLIVFVWASIAFFDASSNFDSPAVFALSALVPQDGQPYPPNWIAAFVLCMFPLAEIFYKTTDSALEIASNKASVIKIASIDATVSSVCDTSTQKDIGVSKRKDDADADAVCLKGVSFTYKESDSCGFSGDFNVKRHSSVAILGRSGAGKSTLAKLIGGVLAADAGSVSILGTDVRDWGHELHKHLGMVEQSPYIFNQSIKENLLLAKPSATDDEIVDVLERVHLKDMASMRDAYLDDVIGENASTISGGQRQRLAIARLLLSGVDVAVLDEPFVGLDPETEKDILNVLFAEKGLKTLIVVTHHLQDIDRFDRVVFIEDGRITLDGSPKELRESSDYFASLLSFDGSVFG